ncbi:hypothetical protein Cflav_PD4874 [Pedosphaera parvula Ellin514]|uniref:Uncharacterized protein n=1 Tax=Pedosphaera parvula (strain Ellin514) TaxID=320771 RepID=B9XCP3_PEDPL|nr:hypothetical protein Cflav_PD4874 [Pedosphaera parvula Ellin514]
MTLRRNSNPVGDFIQPIEPIRGRGQQFNHTSSSIFKALAIAAALTTFYSLVG